MTPSPSLTDLQSFIQESGWDIRPGKPINYGEQFIISDGNNETIVNYYPRRGKFSTGGPECELKDRIQIFLEIAPLAVQALVTTHNLPHIGMDESGKGDWFGPLVIAAVYLDEPHAEALTSIGVKDSKKLSAEQISLLATQIRDRLPSSWYHITIVDPDRYNSLYANFQNINLLLAEQYAQTADVIWQRTQAPQIICDQFSQLESRLADAFQSFPGLPHPTQLHHAENSSIAVAAASILATDAFRTALDELSQRAALTFALPRGSSDTVKLLEAVDQLIARNGASSLSSFAKVHFRPIADRFKGIAEASPFEFETLKVTHGDRVTVRQRAWQVTEHNGYVRFTFYDGGILDWYNGSTGKFAVKGKSTAPSYKLLHEKANGKSFRGEIDRVRDRITALIPEFVESIITCVQGVGWIRGSTVFGYRFRFTDGAQVAYYVQSNKIVLQGTLKSPTKNVLEHITALTHTNADDFAQLLRVVFPDYSLGETAFANDEMVTMDWQALENALDWQAFWDSNRSLRRAANLRSPCQREFVDDWASVLSNHQSKRHLLAHAPTGLGKTVSALVPALAWIARSLRDRRVYYLVNRSAQHDNPIRELSNLAPLFEAQTGQSLKVVDLAGRAKACVSPSANPAADICRHSIEEADFSLLPQGVSSWQQVRQHLGDAYCPYHLLRSLVDQAHVIICDYWWWFSAKAQQSNLAVNLGFPFANAVVIVDEAHNLPLRMRQEIDVEVTFDLLREQTTEYLNAADRDQLNGLIKRFAVTQGPKEVDATKIVEYLGGSPQIATLLAKLEDIGRETVEEPELVKLLRALQLDPTDIFIYVTDQNSLICRLIDPAALMEQSYHTAFASLSMSGTLSAPRDNEDELRFLVPLFGLPEPLTLVRKYYSPFHLTNQRWIYNPDVRGTYERRYDHVSYYAQQIVESARATPGVTAAFFSGYDFLTHVFEEIKRLYPDESGRIICERADNVDSNDTLSDIDAKLQSIVKDQGYAVLLAIYQGQLGEGANFSGNLIKTIICISIPMQLPSEFHLRLQQRYEQRLEHLAKETRVKLPDKAKEYALDRYSLSLVLQVCGRGIRHENDRCAFLLLDQRYHEYQWRRFLMPMPYNLSHPASHVRQFHQPNASQITLAWDTALVRKFSMPIENED